jgi:integrase/recombinase XerD
MNNDELIKHETMIEKLVQRFILWLKSKNYKARGIDEYQRTARDYMLYMLNAEYNMFLAGRREAEEYREHLHRAIDDTGKKKLSPATINCRIAHLRLFYRFLISDGMTARNPFLDIGKMKEHEKLPVNILTIKDMGKLLSAIDVKTKDDFKFKTIVEVLYSTGSRISEIENLTRADVRLVEGYLEIRDDKSRSTRPVPLTEYASKLLSIYITHSRARKGALIFAHGEKRTMNRWVGHRLMRLCQRIDLPVITCHSIRHITGTHLLKSGADIREVQEYLGHRRIKNTEVYTRIFPEDLKEVIEKNHPREKDNG